jgi:hypothetical protein
MRVQVLDVLAAELFQFLPAEFLRVYCHAAFAAAQRQADRRRFEAHQSSQCPYFIQINLRVEAYTALIRPKLVFMLDTVSFEAFTAVKLDIELVLGINFYKFLNLLLAKAKFFAGTFNQAAGGF